VVGGDDQIKMDRAEQEEHCEPEAVATRAAREPWRSGRAGRGRARRRADERATKRSGTRACRRTQGAISSAGNGG
jgi:hypothetical protein